MAQWQLKPELLTFLQGTVNGEISDNDVHIPIPTTSFIMALPRTFLNRVSALDMPEPANGVVVLVTQNNNVEAIAVRIDQVPLTNLVRWFSPAVAAPVSWTTILSVARSVDVLYTPPVPA